MDKTGQQHRHCPVKKRTGGRSRSPDQEDPTRIQHIKGVLCCTWSPRDSPETVYELRSRQETEELETMRQKYEAWTKRAEDLTNENELLKKEIKKVKEEQD